MNRGCRPRTFLIWIVFASPLIADDTESGFKPLFNGKDLRGWEGDAEAWTVRDGVITCSGNSKSKNWLIWRGGRPSDFELRLRFRFTSGNTGVQVRSREVGKWQVQGYQAEIAERAKMGKWHHSLKPAEHRHYLATAGQRVRIHPDGKKEVEQVADAEKVRAVYDDTGWNDLTIIARGSTLVQKINGIVVCELVDEEREFASCDGLIALQDHGKGTKAQFKNIRMKLLEDQGTSRSRSVGSVQELRDAVDSLGPGDVLEISPGTYALQSRLDIKARGTEEQPVVIRAKSDDVRMSGEGGITIEHSSQLTLDGIYFQTKGGLRIQHSDQMRVTNCRFHLRQTGTKAHWLSFDDTRHGRVDHCEFGARSDPGSYIHISRGNRYFRIDRNYFHDYPELGHNGGESIYLHGTGVWALHAVVEKNLFERCNAEGELIGIKSHRNIIRGNTFKDCKGAVSIRDGNYNSVYNNVFLALNEPRAAGIRIHGVHNAAVNNYFYGIYKPIECCWGETDPPHEENLTGHGAVTKLAFAYRAAYDNLVAHNTFVACDTIFQWTKKNIPIEQIREKMGDVERNGPFLAARWKRETSQHLNGDYLEPMFPPRRWLVFNNVMLDTPQLVRVNLARGTPGPVREQDFLWRGNLAFVRNGQFETGAERSFDEAQFRFADPQLVEERQGVFQPSSTSICRDPVSIDRQNVKPVVDRPEIDDLFAKPRDLGASKWQILKVTDVGPRIADTDARRQIKLFDGKTLIGWTDAEGNPVGKGWHVDEGMLVSNGGNGSIFTADEYSDFDLSFEWKVAARGNSGVKYRVAFYEHGVRGRPGWLGCEYQIWDDVRRPAPPEYSSAAIYGLMAPASTKKLRVDGQFNKGRIVVRGSKIEHWLNGDCVAVADTSTSDWKTRLASSKFSVVPGFFQNRTGRIELQDHDDKVWFRNIVLTPLDDS